MLLTLISLLLAFAMGFTAFRAGICTVSAVAEVRSSGTARVFLSFLKVILWVVLVTGLLELWLGGPARPPRAAGLSMMSMLGGFLFGVGAAINGGCSFSTISKIAQGNLHMALTLPAFVLGVVISAGLPPMGGDRLATVPTFDPEIRRLLLVPLALWGIWEIAKIVTPNLRGDGIWRGLAAKRYRLSTGAALVGICSGFLYTAHGRWAYSSRIVDAFVERPGAQITDGVMAIGLIVALLGGAVASAVSNGTLSFSFARDMWRRNLIGGFLMGFGAMMVPGGNGALILQDLPSLSLRGALAYLAMVVGIAVTLALFMRITGGSMAVSCGGDFCTVEKKRPRSGSD